MSAISVLFQLDGGPASLELLDAMLVAQRASGPDGDSAWADGAVALGQARYIATAGAERKSGVTSLNDRLHVTADARIDAREDLLERLRARGHALDTMATDEAVLVHVYECWGEAGLESLIGDYAFALWDAARRRLVCGVDPLGAKPLFYACRGSSFCAASSVDAVRLHPDVRDELDEVVVGDFLLQGCTPDRGATIYADIARVPPGHLLIVDAAGPRLHRYFAWPEESEMGLGRHPDPVSAFEELLGKAVRDRLRTPRVAVFLSGGIDSPLVAATAKQVLARASSDFAIEGFTGVYDQLIQDDERHFAGLVGRHLQIPIDFQALDGGTFFDWTERLTPAQPLDATVMEPWLGQIDRLRQRFGTVLTGTDGDALTACAPRLHFRQRLRAGEYRQLLADVAIYVAQEHGPPPIGLRTAWARVRDQAAVRSLPPWLESTFVRRTNLTERWAELWHEPTVTHSRAPALGLLSGPAWGRRCDLYRADTLGFALEVLSPLADLRVIRFALELPAVPWCVSKRVLREAAHALPAAVRRRPKTPLSADPDVERFARGKRPERAGWVTGELPRFVDVGLVGGGFAGSAVPDDFTERMRALCLGFWLAQRQGRRPAGEASPV